MSAISIKTILALLALSETATEADVVDKVKSFEKKSADADARVAQADGRVKAAEGEVAKLLAATGVDNIEKALGAIEAGKAAVGQLAEQAKTIEGLERAKVISDAKAAKKLTPAQEKGLEGKSLEFVKGFIELQHTNPTLAARAEAQPETREGGAITWNGKSWSDLKPGEKHALHNENKDLYEAMRDAAAEEAA